MSTPGQVSQLVSGLRDERAEAQVSLDEPRDSNGEWWLDIRDGEFKASVSWQPRRGFGIFTAEEAGLGDRPDEIYANPTDAYTRLCQIMAAFATGRAGQGVRLKELRQILGASQVDVAEKMNIDQAVISRMENRGDMYLSSLEQYVAAVGGEPELRVRSRRLDVRIATARPGPRGARPAKRVASSKRRNRK